ncbi:MAG TPA: polysaccharide biosynthesis/export family protein [Candidatus Aquilonibacter sp.]|nr:polysaccharide biosynthesis/export family protein [Candidatus Aquilonibacter sp.]
MKLFAIAFTSMLAMPGVMFGQNEISGQIAGLPNSTATSQEAPLRARAPSYQLRRGDSFEIEFTFSPEFNQMVTVEPDGYITLKSAGTIHVEGLTIPKLTAEIEQKYAGTLHDPVVTIDLKDIEKPYFIAAGQVGKPGKYDLRSDLTLTEGVAIAGGFTEASKHSQVVLYRPGPNGVTEARLVDAKKMLRSHNLAEDIHLQPGDMIYVPQNRISKISRYLPTSSLGLYGNPALY